jgi:hypothetical protein
METIQAFGQVVPLRQDEGNIKKYMEKEEINSPCVHKRALSSCPLFIE